MHRIAVVALAVVFLLRGITIGLAQEADLAEAVKATYLYKFAPFVQWPSAAVEFPNGVFTICIAGDDRFADVLRRAANGQTIDGHNIAVRILASVPTDTVCSVLYLGSADAQQEQAMLAAVRGKPILTVSDEATNPAARGIINFVVRDNRVRFEIDGAAATADGLAISSKLLSLAVAVHTAGH